jgi:shikimate dehydrogenase
MKLYGLIGYPLGHSFSKKYFTDKFVAENLHDCSYELFPIPFIKEFPSLIKTNPFLNGLNVTIPYKQKVLEFVTEQTEEVKIIGAANTLKVNGENILAYNTDIIGFERSFIKQLRSSQTKALILGTGGSSKAVEFVLRKLGIAYLLVTRNEKLEEEMINYSKINEEIINEYKIIINCTPAGMYPNTDECPLIPYQYLSKEHYLFDLVYNPEKTLFLKRGEEKGATIKNGYEMLVLQAEESWRIWNEG